MLASHRDEDKFVALLLILQVVSPEDDDAIRRVVAQMDWSFLSRLLASRGPGSGDIKEQTEQTKEYWRVGCTVLRELAPFVGQIATEVLPLLPGLLEVLRSSIETEPLAEEAAPQHDEKVDENEEGTDDQLKGSCGPQTDNEDAGDSNVALPLPNLVAATLADMLRYLPESLPFFKSSLTGLAATAIVSNAGQAIALSILDLVSHILLLSEPQGHCDTCATLAQPPAHHSHDPTSSDVLAILLPRLASDLATRRPPFLLAPCSALLTFLHKPSLPLLPHLRRTISLLLLRSRARSAKAAESHETFRVLSTCSDLYGPEFWNWSAAELGEKMLSGGQALAIAIGIVGAEVRVLLELVDGPEVEGAEQSGEEAVVSSSSSSAPAESMPQSSAALRTDKSKLPETLLPVLLPLLGRLIEALLNDDLSIEPDTLLPIRRTLSEAFLAVAAFLAEHRDRARLGDSKALEGEIVFSSLDALGSYIREEEEAQDMRTVWIEVALDLFRSGSFPDCVAGMLDEIFSQPGAETWRNAFEEENGWHVLVEGLFSGPRTGKESSAGWELLRNEVTRQAQENRMAPAPARGTHLMIPKGVSPSDAAHLVTCNSWRGNIAAATTSCLLLSLLWELYPEERQDSTARAGLDWIIKTMLKPAKDDWEHLDEALFHLSRTILGYPHFATLLSNMPFSRTCSMPLLSLLFANKTRIGPWFPVALAKRGSMKGRQLVVDAAGGTLRLTDLVQAPNGWENVLHAVGYEGHWWERSEEGFYS
jgi:hypothetical protein